MTNDLATSAYWDKSWMNTQLPRQMHPSRNPLDRKFQKFLKKHIPVGGKFLEIGCAASHWMPFFGKDMKYELYGVDYSQSGLDLTKKNLEFFCLTPELFLGEFTEMNLNKNFFDVVYSGGVIEHYQDPTPILRKAFEILKPGGLKLTVIPNNWGLVGTIQKRLDRGVFDLHMPFGAKDVDRFHSAAGFKPLVAAVPFGVFYCGVFNWQGQTRHWPVVLNRAIAYSLQALDRTVGWLTYPFGSAFESAYVAPYFIGIYQKPL